jgi:two-component system alkaline phosphatase synthesis response regulator PhoP
MRKILIVDDDKAFRDGVGTMLGREGYAVISRERGDQVLEATLTEKPDLILLDIILPEMNGLEVCRQLRWKGIDIPIIMISSQRKDENDRVVGLETGADDYVVKGMGSRELLARIAACLRRYPNHDILTGYTFDDVEVDLEQRNVQRAGEPIEFTRKEFDVLSYLIKHRGQIVTRDRLLNDVWGYEDNLPTTRTVDTHIGVLRRKLEKNQSRPQHILTVQGQGYKFV